MPRRTRALIRVLADNIHRRVKSGCEVGVWQGVNAAGLLKRFRWMSMYLVDPYTPSDTSVGRQTLTQDAVVEAYSGMLQRTEFALQRRKILIMPSLEAAQLVPDNSLNFCFIDGLHDYNSVVEDLDAWYPKVRRHGVICGDDYGNQANRLGIFGVDRATQEHADKYKLTLNTSRPIWWMVKK